MCGGTASLLIGFLGFILTISVINGDWKVPSGPWVIATKGEPWPLPSSRKIFNDSYKLDINSFEFKVVEKNCEILEDAIKRYRDIIINESRLAQKYAEHDKNVSSTKYSIAVLEIYLYNNSNRYPQLGSDESYDLSIPNKPGNSTARLKSNSIWGILRGLETFSQLLAHSINGHLVIQGQTISDHPRFTHRGLLVDTSRHFIPLDDILLILDAMSYNKMNVLHWHIVDDNSFPYVSKTFPDLSAEGAYHSSMVYTPNDVQRVIEYARFRGIRVIPEFDTPGHTGSWGKAYPQYLTTCYDENGNVSGNLGPMNPLNEELYEFLQSLFSEIVNKFPDKYVHLGGDEVSFDCWSSNPDIIHYMERNNISNSYEKLEELFVKRVLDIVADLGENSIVWQEVFDNGLKLRNDTVVQVWTGNWTEELHNITRDGYSALLSACWYLDHIQSFSGDWLKYYRCEPLSFNGTKHQESLVLGGEACMWSEYVDQNNIHSRVWPRASAAAEILWSPGAQNETIAQQRLEEHACRMNKRGIPAQPPNGPGFCLL